MLSAERQKNPTLLLLSFYFHSKHGEQDKTEIGSSTASHNIAGTRPLVQVLGDAGIHARSAVGTNALPLNVAVEVEAIVEVHPE